MIWRRHSPHPSTTPSNHQNNDDAHPIPSSRHPLHPVNTSLQGLCSFFLQFGNTTAPHTSPPTRPPHHHITKLTTTPTPYHLHATPPCPVGFGLHGFFCSRARRYHIAPTSTTPPNHQSNDNAYPIPPPRTRPTWHNRFQRLGTTECARSDFLINLPLKALHQQHTT